MQPIPFGRATAVAVCVIVFAHLACAAEPAARATAPALELVGTMVDATTRFAVLRGGDRIMSVRVGDEVDGLTVATIVRERVEMRSRDGKTQRIVWLGEPAARAPDIAPAAADDTIFNDPTYTGRIAQGINTDQSLPEHPVRGPTATLPPGEKESRH